MWRIIIFIVTRARAIFLRSVVTIAKLQSRKKGIQLSLISVWSYSLLRILLRIFENKIIGAQIESHMQSHIINYWVHRGPSMQWDALTYPVIFYENNRTIARIRVRTREVAKTACNSYVEIWALMLLSYEYWWALSIEAWISWLVTRYVVSADYWREIILTMIWW